jgi:glycosyltransferase involved in cell wall biosynthesis
MHSDPAVEPQRAPEQSDPAGPEPRPTTPAGYSTNGEPTAGERARVFHGAVPGAELGLKELPRLTDARPALALFCYEGPETAVGSCVARLAAALARRGRSVRLFTRQEFPAAEGVSAHAVGGGAGELLAGVEEYTRRACAAFLQQFPARSARPALLAFEWSATPAAAALKQHTGGELLLSLHSLERQRSASLESDLSRRIDELELAGVREARLVLLHNDEAGELLKFWAPDCAERTARAREPFPLHKFTGVTDPGVVKARFQIGPVDPLILYLGDLDERHGPDLLMKSAPAILKNHRQAHFAFVGDGSLLWPLRVYARYLLLEHRVRLIGHLEGPALYELIQAADIVVAPSREHTEWWPFQAAWAARRPVVASHALAGSLMEHERDCVRVYPHESSVVWGVERLLYDAGLRERVARAGYEKLEKRFGWNSLAEQIEELMGVRQTV